jgi:4'-phosphopantetheinyl transferase
MKRMFGSAKPEDSRACAVTLLWPQPPVHGLAIAAAVDSQACTEAEFATLLSADELHKAERMTDAIERRHFMFRRGFQRVFVHHVLKLDGPVEQISILHQRDCRPQCLNAPDCHLSFSSSGTVALACASTYEHVGVDIEKTRPVENVAALAKRFFNDSESAAIAALPANAQDLAFLRHWTAKEAGLKAIGEGVEFGINSFILTAAESGYAIHREQEFADSESWKLQYLTFLPEHVVAVVHRPVD